MRVPGLPEQISSRCCCSVWEKTFPSERDEIYGINVFKVREVLHAPEITRAPEMAASMEGMVSLRGVVVPVINLPKFCGIQSAEEPRILIVTEYNRHVQAFLSIRLTVSSVLPGKM